MRQPYRNYLRRTISIHLRPEPTATLLTLFKPSDCSSKARRESPTDQDTSAQCNHSAQLCRPGLPGSQRKNLQRYQNNRGYGRAQAWRVFTVSEQESEWNPGQDTDCHLLGHGRGSHTRRPRTGSGLHMVALGGVIMIIPLRIEHFLQVIVALHI